MHLRVVCLVDWHLEVFYYPYYKIKNAGVHELNFIHPNIYYRTQIKSTSKKHSVQERTAAQWNSIANATRPRRRILRCRLLCSENNSFLYKLYRFSERQRIPE